jgi:chemotaxis protein MotB
MRRRPEVPDAEGEETPDFWVAYSDLLVSLLMVFALLFFLALSKMQKDVETIQAVGGTIEEAITVAQESLEGTGTGIRVDSVTKAITLDAEVLFEYGSAELQPGAKQAIDDIATRFLPGVIANPAVDTMLQEISVIGHTDTVGSYMYNLQLSQARAYAVMRRMVETTYGQPYARRLRRLIVASGKSEVDPALDSVGNPDARASRRIEIRVRPRNDALLERIFSEFEVDTDQ